MKKILSMALAVCLLFSTASVSAFAAGGSDKELEKAIQTVKKVVDIPKEYTEFDYSSGEFSQNGSKSTVWSLTWSDPDGNGSISASVDTTDVNHMDTDGRGNLLTYGRYQYDIDKEGLAKVSRSEAERTARAFLNSAMPDEAIAGGMRQVKESENKANSYNHIFDYMFYHQEIPASFLTVRIEVDKYTGMVTSFQGFPAGNKLPSYPSQDGVIGEAAAKASYLDKAGVTLAYHSNFDYKTKKLTVFPAYQIADRSRDTLAVDAKTGELKRFSFSAHMVYLDSGEGMAKASGNQARDEAMLTPEEQAAVDGVSGLISQERAADVIRKAAPGLSADSKYDSISFNKNSIDPDRYIWNVSFENAYGSVDAKTGELLSFYVYRDSAKSGKTVTEDAARKTAEAFARQIAPETFAKCKLEKQIKAVDESTKDSAETFSFRFLRQENGIDFVDNGITITVNSDGQVSQYDKTWYDSAEFPTVENAISADQAFDKLNEIGHFGLAYERTAVNDQEASLVYEFGDSLRTVLIDPLSGERLGDDGKAYPDSGLPEYTDLKGHWSENVVNQLLENGYYIQGTEFKPNQPITQLGFLKYLYSPGYSTVDQDNFYRMLERNGILKPGEKNPDQQLARQDAAKYLIRYMGLEKAAAHPEIFNVVFKDSVAQEYRGYAALCQGLGIMKGDKNNQFNGSKVMTNAEAASAIYQMLEIN